HAGTCVPMRLRGDPMAAVQIAYFTTDEVNLDSAERAARECGASLGHLRAVDGRPTGSFAALLYDLDDLGTARGRAVLDELLSRPSPFPVAVHGYDLGEEGIASLEGRGLLASRHFDPEMIRGLCRAAAAPRGTGRGEEGRDAQETADDPAILCGAVRSLA